MATWQLPYTLPFTLGIAVSGQPAGTGTLTATATGAPKRSAALAGTGTLTAIAKPKATAPLTSQGVLLATALGVGDRLLDRQRGALGPRGIKVRLAQGIMNRRHRGLVARVPDLEADRAHTLPDGVCRAEEPGRFDVAAAIGG